MKRNNKNINLFIKYINDKIPYRYFFKRIYHNISVYRFRKNILNGNPSFAILWQMADFIKLANTIFFYNNHIDNYLFSSTNFTSGQNGFIARDDGVKIIIKLYKDTKNVTLDICRLYNTISKTTMSFTQDEWDKTPTVYDELLLEQVIKIINKNIIKLFDECYRKM